MGILELLINLEDDGCMEIATDGDVLFLWCNKPLPPDLLYLVKLSFEELCLRLRHPRPDWPEPNLIIKP